MLHSLNEKISISCDYRVFALENLLHRLEFALCLPGTNRLVEHIFSVINSDGFQSPITIVTIDSQILPDIWGWVRKPPELKVLWSCIVWAKEPNSQVSGVTTNPCLLWVMHKGGWIIHLVTQSNRAIDRTEVPFGNSFWDFSVCFYSNTEWNGNISKFFVNELFSLSTLYQL